MKRGKERRVENEAQSSSGSDFLGMVLLVIMLLSLCMIPVRMTTQPYCEDIGMAPTEGVCR